MKLFKSTTLAPYLKTWGLGIIILSLITTLAIFWLLRQEPMPTPGALDTLPEAMEQPKLTRTDTLEQKRLVSLLNATPRELMTVYLQTWSIVPPKAISVASDRIWSFAEVPAKELLDWTADIYNYAVIGEGTDVRVEKTTMPREIVNQPEHLPSIPVQAGKLGDSLWHAMRDAEFEFFAILPEETSNSPIKAQDLATLLAAHNIHLAKRDQVFILWKREEEETQGTKEQP